MCTVSVIPLPGGYRLVHNRDEQRARPAAQAPTAHPLPSSRRATWPTDPAGGGTWVALRDDGFSLAVMNVNPAPPPPMDRAGLRSRGLLIPALIDLDTAEAVDAALAAMDLGPFAPFRLVAVAPRVDGPPEVRAWTWRREGDRAERSTPAAPVCWPTSGLGDARVASRGPLFARMVGADPSAAAQDGYHAFAEPGKGPENVLMSRRDARTVSITTLEVDRQGSRMRYVPIPEAPPDGDG